MNKEKLQALIQSVTDKIETLVTRSDKSEDVVELRALNADIAEARRELSDLNALMEDASREEARGKNPLPKAGVAGACKDAEYRSAFKAFVQHGTPIPADLVTPSMNATLRGIMGERRAAGTTVASEISALIPVTVMDEVVRTAATGAYGQLFSRVRKLNVRGGVRFPLSSLEAKFTWGVEGTCPVGQKAGTANTYIEFGSYLGLSQINTSIIASIESEAVFYQELVKLIREAFYEAMDKAIVSGSGNGQPLGITVDPRVTNSVTLSTDEISNWKAWEKVVAAIPLSKRGGHIVLPIGTIDKYVRTLTDDNNRPLFFDSSIALGKEEADGIEGRFDGQYILAVENGVMKSFDEANAGDVIGFYAPLRDYAVNSNLQFAVTTFRDEKCLEDITRGLVIIDGKPLDTTGMVLIKKA